MSIIGILVPRQIFSVSRDKAPVFTGTPKLLTSRENVSGVVVGKSLFGGQARVTHVFLIDHLRLGVLTELGDVYLVFAERPSRDLYTEKGVRGEYQTEKTSPTKPIFKENTLQIFRLPSPKGKLDFSGESAMLKMEVERKAFEMPPSKHAGVLVGRRLPGVERGGVATFVVQIDGVKAIAVTTSGATYFLRVVR